MCKNERKLELEPEPCYEKIELRNRNRSCSNESKSSGAGSGDMFMKRRIPEPEQCYRVFTPAPQPWLNVLVNVDSYEC